MSTDLQIVVGFMVTFWTFRLLIEFTTSALVRAVTSERDG